MSVATRQRHIQCPKCRVLGSGSDCTDSITYARRKTAMTLYGDDEPNELIVTVTFAVPVTEDDDEILREKATRLRDMWSDEPDRLLAAIADVGDDYELQVKPFSEA